MPTKQYLEKHVVLPDVKFPQRWFFYRRASSMRLSADEPNRVVIKGHFTQIVISKNGPDSFLVGGSIQHPRKEKPNIWQVTLSARELREAFPLDLTERTTAQVMWKFRRWCDCLNMPDGQAQFGGGKVISIRLTSDIVEAVNSLLEQQ